MLVNVPRSPLPSGRGRFARHRPCALATVRGPQGYRIASLGSSRFPITCQPVMPACYAPLFFHPAFLLADRLMPESLPCCSRICLTSLMPPRA